MATRTTERTKTQVLDALKRLLADTPADRITLSVVAEQAGVSTPTVRRHLGDARQFRSLLQSHAPEGGLEREMESTRQRILEGASRAFAQHGYSGATLDQVAAEVGLTKGAVYWHFASKADLFLEMYEGKLQAQVEASRGNTEAIFGAEDPEAAFRAHIKRTMASIVQNPRWPWVFFEFMVQSREPGTRERFLEDLRSVNRRVIEPMAAIQERGQVAADLSPEIIQRSVSAMVNGFVLQWMIDPEHIDLESWADDIATLIWRAITPAETGENATAKCETANPPS